MDTTILYVILISMIAIGLPILFYYLKKKHNIDNSDIFEGLDITDTIINFGVAMAIDMKFGNKETINKFKDVLLETLEYIKVVMDNENDKDTIISEAILKATEMCLIFNIELNEQRETIIKTIIIATYNTYYSIQKQQVEE